MNRQLLILSGETISPEMQLFFGHLPSCMVPVRNRVALDFIYHENVNHYDHISIVLKKEAQFVLEYLDHMQYAIEPIVLDQVKDLTYSIEQGLKNIQLNIPTTILFGDTYLPYMTSHLSNEDLLLVSKTTDSLRWTIVDHDQASNTIQFEDKKEIALDSDFNAVIGVFHLNSPGKLLDLLVSNPGRKFYDTLQEYYNTSDSFRIMETDQWIDYGHIDNYFASKKIIEPRFFNNLVIDKDQKRLIKRSHDTEKFINEVAWYSQLPGELKKFVPEIFSFSTDPIDPFIEMRYYHEIFTIHELFINCNFDTKKWAQILGTIQHVVTEFSEHHPPFEVDFASQRHHMYVTKTIDRLHDFKTQHLIDPERPIRINSKEYPSINYIIENIGRIIEKNGLINDTAFGFIHGDLCFPNILYDLQTDDCILIDPRGKFGDVKNYGDVLYEWAKLAHSIDGKYDFIISDRFDSICTGNEIYYKLHTHLIHDEISALFYQEVIRDEQLIKKVKLLQALLFFSMLPLHKNNAKRQFIMLCKAMELVEPFIKEL